MKSYITPCLDLDPTMLARRKMTALNPYDCAYADIIASAASLVAP
jgi:hypothetical protein